MFEYFKKFIKHSMIYAVGNAIYRLASFLLIPLYTRMLSPANYGTLEMFYILSGMLRTFLGLMIAHATLRFFFEYDNEKDKREVISTSLISSLIFSMIGISIIYNFTPEISKYLLKTVMPNELFNIVYAIVIIELTKEIALAYLRAAERSFLYVGIAIIQLIFQVAINYYFVLVLHMGIRGILLGNLISTAITGIFITFITFRYCGFRFSFTKIILLVKYCYPFILSTLAGVIIVNADRIMLNSYKNLAVVGIYALALKIGSGVRDLVIEPFNMNFGQSRFAIMKQKNASDIYAKTLTYFTLFLVFVIVGISLFAKEVFMIISTPRYYDGAKLLPIILITVLIGAASYIFQTGILIKKKTKYIFYINVLSAILIIIFNYLLIPIISSYGAALSSMLASLVAASITCFISYKLVPVNYEFIRIIKIILIGFGCYFILLFGIEKMALNMILLILIKMMLLLSFPVILYFSSFFSAGEKQRIKEYLKRWV